MKHFLRISGLLAVLSASALASTISFTYDIPLTQTGVATAVTIPGFDSSLGILTSVTVSVETSLYAGYSATNIGQVAAELSLEVPFKESVTQGTDTLASINESYSAVIGTVAPGATITNPIGGYTPGLISTTNLVEIATYSAPSITFSDPAYLAKLSGTSSSVIVDAYGKAKGVLDSDDGNFSGSVTTAYAGTVTVTYEYAPEPGTIGMALGGTLCLLFGVRRMRSNQ
jgi:hypothetical protein